jgi:hypothetical protein
VTTWRKGDKLGWGRFGVVYVAYEVDEDGDINPFADDHAIKYLQTDLVAAPEAVARFKREVTILQDLDHPNVMKVVGSGTGKNGVPWFVMRRANGGSLKEAIEDGRARKEAAAVGIMRGILTGMSHAHDEGKLHRDLKPSNVLMHNGEPVVSDFGIARDIDIDGTTLTRTAQELGTLRYMAPEQSADAKRCGKPADVYALGKIFAQMLSGRLPEPLVVDPTGVPEKFRWFIDKCTRTAPTERFTDASAALAKFEQVLQQPDVELPPRDQGVHLANQIARSLGGSGEGDAIETLDAHLQRYDDQQALYHQVLPAIPKPIWERWAELQPEGFAKVISAYDRHVDCGLDFDYCDVAADFLRMVYSVSDDLGVRRTVLGRLMEIGRSHNRWYVRNVTVDLLASMASPSEVNTAEEIIDSQRRDAAWIADQALARPLRVTIADALRRAQADDEAAGF